MFDIIKKFRIQSFLIRKYLKTDQDLVLSWPVTNGWRDKNCVIWQLGADLCLDELVATEEQETSFMLWCSRTMFLNWFSNGSRESTLTFWNIADIKPINNVCLIQENKWTSSILKDFWRAVKQSGRSTPEVCLDLRNRRHWWVYVNFWPPLYKQIHKFYEFSLQNCMNLWADNTSAVNHSILHLHQLQSHSEIWELASRLDSRNTFCSTRS